MKIDYKKELESASKGMILIHDPKTLIKLIFLAMERGFFSWARLRVFSNS